MTSSLPSVERVLSSLKDVIDEDTIEYLSSVLSAAEEQEEEVDFDMIESLLEESGVQNPDEIVKQLSDIVKARSMNGESQFTIKSTEIVHLKSKKSFARDKVKADGNPPPPPPVFLGEESADKPSAGSDNAVNAMNEISSSLNSTNASPSVMALNEQERREMQLEIDLQKSLDETDSYASAWQQCIASGNSWGGRGFGGRGVARRYQNGGNGRDVIVDGVTLAFAGKELLSRTSLRLVAGRRYALLGRNGVGKSTLLRRIAAGALPGFPQHLTVSYLAQEPKAPTGDAAQLSSLDALVQGACKSRRVLLEMEREVLETALSSGSWENSDGENDVDGEEQTFDEVAIAERLSEVDDELEQISAANGAAQEKCYKMLRELGFSEELVNAPVGTLSGGWRMRVELAAALIAQADVLLLDEPTNHLDLKGVLWLEGKLREGNTVAERKHQPTVLVVSHDRAFVAAVATDIILMADSTLNYFDGDLEAYEQREAEKTAANEHRLDARVRQETAARESAAKMKQKAQKSGNDNALKAAKQRLAKVERIGLYRDDGKKYKTNSLAKLDERYVLLPSRAEVKAVSKQDVFKFPSPPLKSKDRPLVSLDDVAISRGDNVLMRNVNAFLYPGSKVAIVGNNGAGKTTLLQALVGNLAVVSGVRTTAPGVKIAYVSQHHVDDLMSDCESAAEGAASMLSRKFKVSELEARGSLGKFGISGDAATRPVMSLSGGQRVRVSLTSITWGAPDVLLLDEPTNHCDMNALDALASALKEFSGACAVVSHNRSFLTACCTELWSIENKKLKIDRPPVNDSTPEAFSNLFSNYASRALGNGTGGIGSQISNSSKATKAATALNAKASTKRGKASAGSSTGFF